MATLTDREYDAELHKLHDQLLLMGAKVEEMIANSMRALTERDSELARRMIEFDHQVPANLKQYAKDPNAPNPQHIHVVVRTPNGNDYGKDLLRQHYTQHSHTNQ